MKSSVRWILAFNASCQQCRGLAERVKRHGGTRLDIMPLSHPEVIDWRKTALGEDAPYAPTLIKITESGIYAWTGLAMAVRLAIRLGLRGTSRLLAALGESRQIGKEENATEGSRGSRRQFLRIAGLGLAFSAIAGKTSPAQASVATPSPAELWVQANKASLPRTYEAFSSYDLEYRRAIFHALSPQERSNLWVAHIHSYQAARPHLNAKQRNVIDLVLETFGEASTFEQPLTEDIRRKMESLVKMAIDALGKDEAYSLGANLGPRPTSKPSTHQSQGLLSVCDCATNDDWCSTHHGNPYRCFRGGCGYTSSGCGWGWGEPCNGECCVATTQGTLCIT
ncbi:hypothetical protein EDD27_10497 [Nonomuraea polychroma]|uniref:Uncharacterized protein n=1 Tax=Nonomuraea polychroma TaxID=46176 RepID=A0A438MP41_9ACTN|nr:bacteriocin fulvocin C-related protein [Nonomuraea polychroma]RVX47560.1 hypothetical protein EDD27_10497 [Nonomuraea polychroma]